MKLVCTQLHSGRFGQIDVGTIVDLDDADTPIYLRKAVQEIPQIFEDTEPKEEEVKEEKEKKVVEKKAVKKAATRKVETNAANNEAETR